MTTEEKYTKALEVLIEALKEIDKLKQEVAELKDASKTVIHIDPTYPTPEPVYPYQPVYPWRHTEIWCKGANQQ